VELEAFDARRLTLARWAAGLTKRELADAIGVSAASVTQYEAGNTAPRPRVAAQAALALGVTANYLYSPGDRRRPLIESRSFFRSLRSTRQWERDQADAYAEHIYDLVDYLERHIKLPELEVPDLRPSSHRPSRPELEGIARETRAAWQMPDGPVSNVVRWLEVKGVVLARLHSKSARLDAFTRWFDKRPLVLLWDGKGDKGRSRFDASHELGHLVMHHEPEPGDALQERQAQGFAAAFLMPASEVVEDLPKRLTRPAHWEELFDARRRWGVSAAALLYRGRELSIYSDAVFRRAMTHLTQLGMRHHDGNTLGEPEQPKLLPSAATEVMRRNGLDSDAFAAELCFSRKLLSEVLGDGVTVESPRPAEIGADVARPRALHSV
jgi:Zn-dependent peptidase ImmA (M78 family)/transcriptional regulator with XRE-family HTH domain